MPGTRKSMPNSAVPLVLEGVSRRGIGLPINLYCDGSLSFGSFGTGSLAARSTSSPYERGGSMRHAERVPCRSCSRRREHSTSRAAAATSISRAAAPACRIGSQVVRTLALPPVDWSPNSVLAPACWMAMSCPVRVEFLRENHRQRGAHALTHFRAGNDDGDLSVWRDMEIGIRRESRARPLDAGRDDAAR